jgi:hypothetical protein
MPFIEQGGMDLLGSHKYTSSVSSSPVISIPPMEMLQIQFNVEGYGSGGGIASLRFNADSTAGNYSSSYSVLTSTTLTNTLGTFAGFKLGQNSVTVQRSGLVTIKNFLSTSHGITCQSQTHAAATSAPVSSVGAGMYVTGGATQITSVQLIVDTGVTMPAGTSFAIFGCNP